MVLEIEEKSILNVVVSWVQVWCLTKSNKVIKMENEMGIKKCSMFGSWSYFAFLLLWLLLLFNFFFSGDVVLVVWDTD